MLLKHFTNQWRSECLFSLLESARVTSGAKNVVAVGDLVLYKLEKTSRAFSKVAKVDQLMSSKDDVVRAAQISVVNDENTASCLIVLVYTLYRVSQKKGYPLKSSAGAACSNLNALTP